MDEVRIVLVGNEVKQLQELRKILSSSHYNIWTAFDLEDAISMTRNTKPDLIILDMDISDGLDYGYRICQELRKSTLCPLIAISEKYADKEWIRALNSCADHYLVRPFEEDWFKGVVASSLRLWLEYRRGERLHDAILHRGDLSIDPNSRTASIKGREIKLTRTEFEILYYLAEQEDRAVSYMELIDAIWGEEKSNIERLRSHIHQVRAKIRNDKQSPDYLLTIPGFGYRLQADGRSAFQERGPEKPDR
jgi:DNA-binding response OmpR family regulator